MSRLADPLPEEDDDHETPLLVGTSFRTPCNIINGPVEIVGEVQ